MTRGKPFSTRALIAGFFLVGGAIFLLFCGAIAVDRFWSRAIPVEGVFASGAFLGGVIAAIASRERTVLEPALGACLVIGALALEWALSTGPRALLGGPRSSPGSPVYVLGTISAVLALAGASLGERLARPRLRGAPTFWALAAFLVGVGEVQATLILFAVVLVRLPDWLDGLILLSLIVMTGFGAGAITQSLAPIPTTRSARAGIVATFGFFGVGAAAMKWQLDYLVPFLLLGLLASYFVSDGVEWAKECWPALGEELPEAREIDRQG